MTKNLATQFHRLEEQISSYFQARLDAEQALRNENSELIKKNQDLRVAYDAFAGRLRDIGSRLNLERQRVRKLVQSDPLTQLPNRVHFQNQIKDMVAAAGAQGHAFVLIVIDLKGFRNINTTFGYGAGDALLQTIASRLSQCIGEEDYVARIGNDEFAIVVHSVTDIEDAKSVADQLLSRIQAPVVYERRHLNVNAALGVVCYPQHGRTARSLVCNADLALDRARTGTKGRVIVFHPNMAQTFTLQRTLGQHLRAALRDRLIRIFFQPIVDLQDQTSVGLEALMRWHHDEHGWIAPVDILAIAAEYGLLTTLTRYIFETSIRKVKPGLDTGRIQSLALNLTARDLRDPELSDFLLDCLARHGIDPKRITLEITEHTVVTDMVGATHVMTHLGGHGVRFAIDDFGIGYSNLLTLNRLPFHTLKIDRSFVAEITENEEVQTIVSAVIDLAHALDLSVIAEGIESREQLAIVSSLGCDFGQGYLFGHPRPLSAVLKSGAPNLNMHTRARDLRHSA